MSSLRHLGALSCVVLTACSTSATTTQETSAPSQPQPADTTPPAEQVMAPEPTELERFTQDLQGEGRLMVDIQTDLGVIACELFKERAPSTVTNFVGLARGMSAYIDPISGEQVEGQPFYDGVIFHRVIPDFMVQTGDRTGSGSGNPGYKFADEFHPDLRHSSAGVLSMANSGPDTNGSQFFITVRATPHLDERHSVFGQCAGLDVLNAIVSVPTSAENRPLEAVKIQQMRFYHAP